MVEQNGSGYGRGLDFLMKQRARVQSSGDFVRKLFLTQDGSIAQYRHLTDASDIFAHNFHEVEVQGRRKSYVKDVVCLRKVAPDDDGDPVPVGPVDACAYCNRAEPLAAWWKGIGWVYVYRFFTPNKTSDRAKPAKRGEVHGFVEEANETRLVILKGIIAEQIYTMAGTYGTLTDRDYELHRNGQSGSQFYSVVSLDKGPPNDAVKVALAELPDLTETVFKEFSIGQKAAAPTATTEEVPAGGKAEEKPSDPEDSEIVEF